MLAPVVVAAVTVEVIVEVVALQFPVFSLFSLLLFRYILPPPPPTARPPALPPPPRFTGSPSPAAGPDDGTWKGRSVCRFLQAGHSGGVPLKVLQLSPRFARLAVWLRGEAATLLLFFFFFFSSAAADADAAAAVTETEP